MQWKTTGPVTGSVALVYCEETGQEGFVSVSWDNQFRAPRLFGAVTAADSYDAEGNATSVIVLDRNPTF